MLSFIQVIAAEGPNGRFIPSDVYELVWGAAAFFIVAFLIWTRLIPLLRKAIADSQAAAIDEANAADQAVADARQRVADLKVELGDPEAEAARIVSDAQATAQQIRVESAGRTQQLVNDLWAKAQTDVESMKVQATADIQAEVANQAVGAAEEVVRSSLDDRGQADLIEGYISGLRTS